MKVLASIVVLAAGALVLACGGNSDSDTPATPTAAAEATSAPATGGSGPVTLEVTAENVAFDQDSLSVPANTEVTINFENSDAGVPHDFGVTIDGEERTETCEGPCSGTITFDSGTPGTYMFNCSVHSNMTGDIIVE